jgi:hypothetical protein
MPVERENASTPAADSASRLAEPFFAAARSPCRSFARSARWMSSGALV